MCVCVCVKYIRNIHLLLNNSQNQHHSMPIIMKMLAHIGCICTLGFIYFPLLEPLHNQCEGY